MLGLGAYQSSSEDEQEADRITSRKVKVDSTDVPAVVKPFQLESTELEAAEIIPQSKIEAPTISHQPPTADTNGDIVGPVVGPAKLQGPEESVRDSSLLSSRPTSPFSENRSLIHNLTLPPVPDLDIPPSPPGSPDPKMNAKFSHFLSLKKQGVHFNEKLASSSSLKNPSLLGKLMDHAGIDTQAQYRTSLPADIWDPLNLPSWGFKEELLKNQQDLRARAEEKRSAGQRESIAFVPGRAE